MHSILDFQSICCAKSDFIINPLIQGRGARGAAAGPQVPPFMGGDAQNFFAQWAAAVAAANNNNNNMNNNMNNINNGGQRPPSASAAPQPTPGRSQSGATGSAATAAASTGPNTAAPAVGNPFFFPRPPPFPQVRRFARCLIGCETIPRQSNVLNLPLHVHRQSQGPPLLSLLCRQCRRSSGPCFLRHRCHRQILLALRRPS